MLHLKFLYSVVAVVLTSLGCASSVYAAKPERNGLDSADFDQIQHYQPAAATRLEQGESLLQSGSATQAAELFAQVTAAMPRSALAWRRLCQALIETGHRDEAIAACRKASAREGQFLDFRALGSALVMGKDAPKTEELGEAMTTAREINSRAPSTPWGYALQCEIGEQLGDFEMFNDGLAHLREIAPNHYETRRALAIARAVRPGLGFALGWLAILALVLGTVFHAIRGTWRSHRHVLRGAALVLVALAASSSVLLAAPFALAEDADEHADEGPPASLSKWHIDDDEHPEKALPTAEQRDGDPLNFGYLLMDLSDRGDYAFKTKNYKKAARYYLTLAKAVPDRSIGLTKACDAYDALGEWDNAIVACHEALGRPGIRVRDYEHYINLLVGKPTAITDAEARDADEVLKHLTDQKLDKMAGELGCRLGVRLESAPRLQVCTTTLMAVAPNEPETIRFQWALAMFRRDYAEARALVLRAKAAGMAPERVKHLDELTRAATPIWRAGFRDWRVLAMFAVVLLGMAAMIVALRRRQRTVTPHLTAQRGLP